ncbi:uncharacterized protein [Dermacentor albipictus]|uniref:uncharacterized protein n=1 Tax=Dermacentor albipictus TaxID=60249 RepID=UPI0038FCBE58
MMSLTNPLFLHVQLVALTGVWLSLLPGRPSVPLSSPVLNSRPPLTVTTAISEDDCFALRDLRSAFALHSSGTSTTPAPSLHSEPLKDWRRLSAFSGHGRAAKMMSLTNPLFMHVQVGGTSSLNSKRSNNLCLLLLPCPSVLYDTLCECIFVVKLLLLCGDIEENPGPLNADSSKSHKELLDAIGALSTKIDNRHSEVMHAFAELKENQEELSHTVADLACRLANLESTVECLETALPTADISSSVAQAVKSESIALASRLDDLEDRSRRHNLLFFGIPDSVSETWTQSEEHICELLSRHLNLRITDGMVERAHRLGAYVANKTRPIIVKFSSFKTKESILSQKSKLKSTGVSISEDFCRATRLTRKKLLEFGKSSGQPFSLRFNKLVINNKAYIYSAVTDTVCELVSPGEARATSTRTAPANPAHDRSA